MAVERRISESAKYEEVLYAHLHIQFDIDAELSQLSRKCGKDPEYFHIYARRCDIREAQLLSLCTANWLKMVDMHFRCSMRYLSVSAAVTL